ncbi:septum formation family protein [Nocardiopsis coralliicola]
MSLPFSSAALPRAAGKALAAAMIAASLTMLSGCGTLISAIAQQGQDAPSPEVPSEEEVPSEPAETGPGGTEEDVDAFDIALGDCLNDQTVEGEVQSVPKVDCAEPHDSEVYATTISEYESYPGDGEMETEADDFCYQEFETFVAAPYMNSKYDYSFYTPTQEAFDGYEREIACVIYDPNGPVTGSLAGAGE